MDIKTLKDLNFGYLIELEIDNPNEYSYESYKKNGCCHPMPVSYCTLCDDSNYNTDVKGKEMQLGCISHGAESSDFLLKYKEKADGWCNTPIMFVYENPSNNYDCCYKPEELTKSSENPIFKKYPKYPSKVWWKLNAIADRNSVVIRVLGEPKKYEEVLWALCKEFKLKNIYTTNFIKCGIGKYNVEKPKKSKVGGLKDYNPDYIKNCYNKIFSKEMEIFNPKIIFACSKKVYDYLIDEKNDDKILKDCAIIKLPHPASRLKGSVRFTRNYMIVASALYNQGIIGEDEYINHCITFAEVFSKAFNTPDVKVTPKDNRIFE